MRRPEKETELNNLNNLDRVLVTRLDVTDPESIQAAVKEANDRFGKVDVLLNNAGFGVFGPIEATPLEKIKEQFDTNVFGLLATIKAFLPIFRANRDGIIINISSVAGRVCFPMGAPYHGSKFAVEGLSEALSYEVAPFGVKVKLVEPGVIKTDFKFVWINDKNIVEYQNLYQKMAGFYNSPFLGAHGSDPMDVAQVIYQAATDGTDQLRYVAGKDAQELLSKRQEEDDPQFFEEIRNGKFLAA